MALTAELPGSSAPLSELAHGLIVAARRRGVLDARFFHRLLQQRPEHRPEIQRVMRLFGHDEAPEVLEATEPSPGGGIPSKRRPWLSLDLRIGRLSILVTLGIVGVTLAAAKWMGLLTARVEDRWFNELIAAGRAGSCGEDGFCEDTQGEADTDDQAEPFLPHCETDCFCADNTGLIQLIDDCTQNGGSEFCAGLLAHPNSIDPLLAQFPEAFSIHFPADQPGVQRTSWPDKKSRNFYGRNISRRMGALRDAESILVLGWPSRSSAPEYGSPLAIRRVSWVKELILDQATAPDERDALEAKIRTSVAPAAHIQTSTFHSLWGDRFIAWDRAAEELLSQRNEEMTFREAGYVDQLVNRRVLVVPILCPTQ